MSRPSQKDLFTNRYRQIRRVEPLESEECKAFWDWVMINEARHPELLDLYHVPNGGHRFKATASSLKAMGVRPGRPDYNLDVPIGGFHGLRIEMKRVKSGSTTSEQNETLSRAGKYGYKAAVCHGADQAILVVKEYLGI